MLLMKIPDTSIIDKPWPAEDLEYIERCPYCDSTERTLAYKDVQDWSFYSAPGKWSYWDCTQCEALYLNPRPTESSIGKAYAKYYTHNSSGKTLRQNIKTRIKNECFYHWKNANLMPRLHIPKLFSFLLSPLKLMLHVPFELDTLVSLPKGKLLDVGCGSGNMLSVAKQLGWEVTGLEIDTNAVKAARLRGLSVIEGGYQKLEQLAGAFDCIICSHVLEHVHHPLELMGLLSNALKPHGVLLISYPNAKSHIKSEFGINWRGLEAPRHISIPSLGWMIKKLHNQLYVEIKQVKINGVTLPESIRIRNRKLKTSIIDKVYLILRKLKTKNIPSNSECDIAQILAIKSLK